MKKLIKEPLVHFLLIGLGIFLIYGWVSDEQSDENKIVIDDNHLDHLVSIWELQWNRPPTEEELQGILENYLKQEIFYREALKMNLDHNDEVVKRRLAQKMEFLSDDLSALVDPATDEKLEAFYRENKEDYQVPYQYSFKQVVFTRDRHQDPKAVASEILEKYRSGSPDAMRDHGDRLSIRYHYENLYEPQIDKELGGNLAVLLRDLPLNQWAGPLESGYGVHLVYLTDKIEPFYPEFQDIRDELERDYSFQSEQENLQVIYQTLKKNYEIEITAELDQQILERLQANLIQP